MKFVTKANKLTDPALRFQKETARTIVDENNFENSMESLIEWDLSLSKNDTNDHEWWWKLKTVPKSFVGPVQNKQYHKIDNIIALIPQRAS